MVLSASPPDDASGPATSGWLRRLKVSFGLSRAGLLVLVDHARLERLGELVRTLLPLAPKLEVYTEAPSLGEAPPGSTCVLISRAQDADWLNINRPIFASRALRVVLFCTREVSVELSRKAVDFMDWMSLRLECPPGPPPFAVEGLRRAQAAKVPGIVWMGGNLDASVAAARPNQALRRLNAAQPYAELIAEAKAVPSWEWLAWTDIDGEFRLRRVRWAMAEVGRRTKVILVNPSIGSPGWRTVHGQLMDPHEAHSRLRVEGARQPGRLAALVDFEPESIHLLSALMRSGIDQGFLEKELLKGADPGSKIGQMAFAQKLVTGKQVVRGSAPAPVMRAFGAKLGKLRRVELKSIGQRLSRSEQVGPEDVKWWSAWTNTDTPPTDNRFMSSGKQSEFAEAKLRNAPRTGRSWGQVADIALAQRDLEVAHLWAQKAVDADPKNWTLLARVLIDQGMFADAELSLRQHLLEGKQNPEYEQAWILHELGYVLQQQGRYAEAEEILRQALSISGKSSITQPMDHGASLHVLATSLEQQGRYADAEDLIRQALLLDAQTVGAQHPEYAVSLHELARILGRQGRYAEAEDALRESLRINEQTIGTQHRNYAVSLHELAQMLERQGGYAEAEELMRSSLRIIEQSLGPEHLDRATMLQGLALVLGNQGRYAEAGELLGQALAIKERVLGPKHPQLCSTLANYGFNLTKQGHPQDGEPFIQRSVDLARETWGVDHPETAQGLNLLAMTQSELEKPEALNTARQAVDALVNSLGEEHPITKDIVPDLFRIIEGRGLAKEQE